MIDTFVTFHVLPGKTAKFERLHQQLLARISAQAGCATIRVHRSVTNPLELHGSTEHG
jgi:quinol monooxygenase YgiN